MLRTTSVVAASSSSLLGSRLVSTTTSTMMTTGGLRCFANAASGADSGSQSKKYFALLYNYVENAVEKRKPIRSEHLEFASKYLKEGHLKLGGAWSPNVEGALIVFHVPSKSVVDEFAKNDPYVTKGLVTSYEIKEWTVVADGFNQK